MIINKVLEIVQNFLSPLVEKSIILKFIDKFIFISISAVILLSLCAPSDTIGYLALAAIFLTLIKILVTKGFRFEYTKFELCLIIYLAFVIISTAGASLFWLSLKGILKTFIYLGYYVTCSIYLKDNKKDIYKIFGLFIFCLSYESIVGLLQNSSHAGALAGWQDTSNLNPEEVMTRVYGTLKPLNPNLFGGYMLALVPVIYGITALLAANGSRARFSIGIFISLLSTVVMLMSGCRGVFAAYPFMMLVPAVILFIRCPDKLKGLLYKLYGGICVLGVLLVMFSTSLKARVLSIFAMRGDSSTSFRFNVYQASIQMFKDNPFLGIGVGNQNFRETYGLYMKTGYDALSAYNIYLETAVESGIFALFAFLGFIGFLITGAVRIILNSRNINKVIILTAALTSVCGILLHGFVDTIFFRPQLQFVFWMMVAVIRVLADFDTVKEN